MPFFSFLLIFLLTHTHTYSRIHAHSHAHTLRYLLSFRSAPVLLTIGQIDFCRSPRVGIWSNRSFRHIVQTFFRLRTTFFSPYFNPPPSLLPPPPPPPSARTNTGTSFLFFSLFPVPLLSVTSTFCWSPRVGVRSNLNFSHLFFSP